MLINGSACNSYLVCLWMVVCLSQGAFFYLFILSLYLLVSIWIPLSFLAVCRCLSVYACLSSIYPLVVHKVPIDVNQSISELLLYTWTCLYPGAYPYIDACLSMSGLFIYVDASLYLCINGCLLSVM